MASAGDALGRTNLNIPSIYIDKLPGAAVVERTVTNVTNKAQTIRVKTTMGGRDGGVRVAVGVHVAARASRRR